MTLPIPRAGNESLILVIDDDRRVRELLEMAFGAQGFRVITAADGDEGVRRALRERPDLIVLDVRLPKKSGLEVCELLRSDPDIGDVPIVLVSAAAESETRLMAFKRGADDYVEKPFSPRELLARVKRLLARTHDLRQAREKLGAVERDLARVGEESRRVQLEAERARHLRDLALRLGADLHATRDLDALAHRLLRAAQSQIDAPVIALLVREGAGLVPYAVRGELFDRVEHLAIAPGGELAALLSGLARPVYRHQLEKLSEIEPELHVFAAARMDLLAPVRSARGLEALIVFGEAGAGHVPGRAELESLEALCGIAAVAMANALGDRERAVQAVELTFGMPGAAHAEAAEIVARAARHVPLPPRLVAMVRLGARVGRRAAQRPGASTLEHAVALDTTGFGADFARLIAGIATSALAGADAGSADAGSMGATPETDPSLAGAAELIEVGWRMAEALEEHGSLARAAGLARSERASLTHALRRAVAEALDHAPEDVRVDALRAFDARG